MDIFLKVTKYILKLLSYFCYSKSCWCHSCNFHVHLNNIKLHTYFFVASYRTKSLCTSEYTSLGFFVVRLVVFSIYV